MPLISIYYPDRILCVDFNQIQKAAYVYKLFKDYYSRLIMAQLSIMCSNRWGFTFGRDKVISSYITRLTIAQLILQAPRTGWYCLNTTYVEALKPLITTSYPEYDINAVSHLLSTISKQRIFDIIYALSVDPASYRGFTRRQKLHISNILLPLGVVIGSRCNYRLNPIFFERLNTFINMFNYTTAHYNHDGI